MKVSKTPIEGLLILEPQVYGDRRGYFLEAFNKKAFAEAGITLEFVQDNISTSVKGVVRGLHYQAPPHAQGKLVTVYRGAVVDVAVDIRKNSPTYGQHYKVELSADNHKFFWVPPGFAHGFVTLADDTLFAYKCTDFYNREAEGGILWNDADIGIDWGLSNPTLSDRDKAAQKFKDFDSPFQ